MTITEDMRPMNSGETQPYKRATARPWRGQLVAGAGCALLAALLTLFIPRSSWPQGLLFAIAPLLLGAVFIRSAARRAYGDYVERRAVSAVRKQAPAHWTIASQVPCNGKGDVDLLVQTTDDSKYAIEIKSQRAVSLSTPLLGRECVLQSGRKFSHGDPISQTKQAAASLSAHAVLWFPEAKSPDVKALKCGVLFVAGRAHVLISALQRQEKRKQKRSR